jgi:glycine betaine catabolism B
MALQPWRKGIVKRIEAETWNTSRFWIEIPELAAFDFIPGQFVTLDLPIHEKPNKRWRSYSIASWPDGSNIFELLIVLLEGGIGSTYMFNDITVGSEITFRGPQGVFILPSDLSTELYFICTGTGIAPFRSMLHYIKLHHLAPKQINLIFGTRTKKDLLYVDEMRQLEKDIPQFHFHPTLSREKWEGHTGYVHEVYESLIEEKKQSNVLPPAKFYLCGWRMMIDEAKQKLLAMGYDKSDIHLELYG